MTVTFFVPEPICRYLQNAGVEVESLISDKHEWFDVTLGDVSESDGPAEYVVEIFGVIDRWRNKCPEGFEFDMLCAAHEMIGIGTRVAGNKFVKYRILKKTDESR